MGAQIRIESKINTGILFDVVSCGVSLGMGLQSVSVFFVLF